MSTPQANSPSPDLFARKGSARPAGQLIPYEKTGGNGAQTGPRGTETTEAQDQASPANKEAAGSLLSIEFRRQAPRGDAGAAAEPPVADRTPSEAAPAPRLPPAVSGPAEDQATVPRTAPPPRPDHSHHGLVLAVLTVAGLIAVVWYALDLNRLDLESGLAAVRATDSETAAPEPQAAADPQAEAEETAPQQAEVGPPAGSTAPQEEAAAGIETPEPVAPSFDLIRIEPNGEAILAGRAAPGSELIVLDNGEPIGTVTADAAGEWALVPDEPLDLGEHNFALVTKTPQGTVTVPAPGAESSDSETPAEPGTPGGVAEQERSDGTSEHSSGANLARSAVPERKPELTLDPTIAVSPAFGTVYTVQLSSTPTLSGARQELRKLKQSHPELLGDTAVYVQKARIAANDTRYRVRIGTFSEEAPANALCAAFRSVKQECLVIRR